MEKIASIDVGLKRIGLATSVLGVITPQKPIIRKNRVQASNAVSTFLKENKIKTLIVGLPKSKIDTQKRIKHFISLLDFDGEIVYIDEDMSSVEAEDLMKGNIKYKRDGRVDSIAAMIILERYLANRDRFS